MNVQPRSRWWYRLLQVIYCFFVIFLIIIGAGLTISLLPQFNVNIYSSRYHLKCSGGMQRGDFSGSELNYLETDFDTDAGQKFARFACWRTNLTGDSFYKAYSAQLALEKQYIPVDERENSAIEKIPSTKNYEIELTKREYYVEWWEPILAGFLSLILVPLISLLVRAIFLYIAFEKPFWKTLFLRKVSA